MGWKKEYNTGIALIDEQHQMLYEMICNLETSIKTGEVYRVMGHVLRKLVEYVKEHFEEEEKVMKRIGYPEYERHKQLHKELVNEVVTILRELKEGKEISALELKKFLEKWFIDHILGEDKKIGEFFYRDL